MQSAVQPASTNVKSLLPVWAWNVLALFFAGWLITAGWQLASGYDAPAIRLAFAVSGVLCLTAGDYGKLLSLRLSRHPILASLVKTFITLLLISGAIGVILWPMFSQASNMSRAASACSILRQNGIALLEYAKKHNGKLPPDMHRPAIGRYLIQGKLSGDQETSPKVPIQWSTGISGLSPADFAAPADVLLAYSDEIYGSHGHAILFLDGHTRLVPDARLREILYQQPALIAQAEKIHAKRFAASRKHNTHQ